MMCWRFSYGIILADFLAAQYLSFLSTTHHTRQRNASHLHLVLPAALTPADVLTLQRTARLLQPMLQAKLKLGSADDMREREADRVADQVVRQSERTMPKRAINPPSLFPSRQYGFSQIVTSGNGTLVFISGQVAWDENQQVVGPGDLRAQTWQAFRNVETAIGEAGGTLADIVSMRIYIVAEKLEESRAVRDALLTFFPGDAPPTTTWIGVHSLANSDFLIEIEPIAVIEATAAAS